MRRVRYPRRDHILKRVRGRASGIRKGGRTAEKHRVTETTQKSSNWFQFLPGSQGEEEKPKKQ
jgi:hypothetical protein